MKKVIIIQNTFLNQSNTILIARGLMLRGLVDPDDDGMHPNHNDNDDSNQEINEKEGIRKMIYKFFDEHYGLSKNPYSRLETLMTDLYNVHENSNQKWLVLIFFCIFCINILLLSLYKVTLFDIFNAIIKPKLY